MSRAPDRGVGMSLEHLSSRFLEGSAARQRQDSTLPALAAGKRDSNEGGGASLVLILLVPQEEQWAACVRGTIWKCVGAQGRLRISGSREPRLCPLRWLSSEVTPQGPMRLRGV